MQDQIERWPYLQHLTYDRFRELQDDLNIPSNRLSGWYINIGLQVPKRIQELFVMYKEMRAVANCDPGGKVVAKGPDVVIAASGKFFD